MAADDMLGLRPLYRQTRDLLVQRIVDGVWAPGAMLPSETELARSLGVSQGTVRKALDEMAAERLVERRQGRGTYVARLDDTRILFQFFKLVPDEGERRFPESRTLDVQLVAATAARDDLGVAAGGEILRIRRVRSLGDRPCVVEEIELAAARFTGLAERVIPNNLYQLYAVDYGITVASAVERLKAVAADALQADALGIGEGTPLLAIDRRATALDGLCVERRLSVCRTDDLHYLSELR